MKLTDIQIQSAEPKGRNYKLSDGNGMYLLVTKTGSRLWRCKFRFKGKEKLLAFGVYPDVSLPAARKKLLEARNLLASGIDPSAKKKSDRRGVPVDSFKSVARDWLLKQYANGAWTQDHASTILSRMEKDVLPWIGGLSLPEIHPENIKEVLDRVKSRGAFEAARRVLTIIGQVYKFAIAAGLTDYDVAAGFKEYLSEEKGKRKHAPVSADPNELASVLRAVHVYRGSSVTKSALLLLPMLFVRPGQLRQMEWSEIDFSESLWRIPAGRVNMKNACIVPLCSQSVELLTELRPLTGGSRYVFPSARTYLRPMSDNTLNAAFKRMGFSDGAVTCHRIRTAARLMLEDALGGMSGIVELQMGLNGNGKSSGYDASAHLEERREMMQIWADYLDELKADV